MTQFKLLSLASITPFRSISSDLMEPQNVDTNSSSLKTLYLGSESCIRRRTTSAFTTNHLVHIAINRRLGCGRRQLKKVILDIWTERSSVTTSGSKAPTPTISSRRRCLKSCSLLEIFSRIGSLHFQLAWQADMQLHGICGSSTGYVDVARGRECCRQGQRDTGRIAFDVGSWPVADLTVGGREVRILVSTGSMPPEGRRSLLTHCRHQ